MKRAALVAGLWLSLAGCLSPGAPLYGKLDEKSPRMTQIVPPIGGDAGLQSVAPKQFIVITFSEQMELDSLRAGIVVRNRDRREMPLTIQVEPSQIRPVTAQDPDGEFSVQISSAEPSGFVVGPYQLILRTLLIDQQGNGLDGEFLGAFYVQF